MKFTHVFIDTDTGRIDATNHDEELSKDSLHSFCSGITDRFNVSRNPKRENIAVLYGHHADKVESSGVDGRVKLLLWNFSFPKASDSGFPHFGRALTLIQTKES
jgi:hypothetical protein